MKAAERDELLIAIAATQERLDERSSNTWRAIEKIEQHLSELNGQVKTNTTFRKIGTWVSCAIVIALFTIAVRILVGA